MTQLADKIERREIEAISRRKGAEAGAAWGESASAADRLWWFQRDRSCAALDVVTNKDMAAKTGLDVALAARTPGIDFAAFCEGFHASVVGHWSPMAT